MSDVQADESAWKRGPDGQLFRRKSDGSWWWEASDGQWYREEQHPSYRRSPTPPPVNTAVTEAEPSDAASGPKTRRVGAWLLLAGGGAAVIGSFLPWVTITSPFLGTENESGIGGDGIFTLVFGVAIALIGLDALRAGGVHRRRLAGFLILGLGAITVFEFVNMSAGLDDNPSESISAWIGIGPYVIAAGVVAAFIGFTQLPPRSEP